MMVSLTALLFVGNQDRHIWHHISGFKVKILFLLVIIHVEVARDWCILMGVVPYTFDIITEMQKKCIEQLMRLYNDVK